MPEDRTDIQTPAQQKESSTVPSLDQKILQARESGSFVKAQETPQLQGDQKIWYLAMSAQDLPSAFDNPLTEHERQEFENLITRASHGGQLSTYEQKKLAALSKKNTLPTHYVWTDDPKDAESRSDGGLVYMSVLTKQQALPYRDISSTDEPHALEIPVNQSADFARICEVGPHIEPDTKLEPLKIIEDRTARLKRSTVVTDKIRAVRRMPQETQEQKEAKRKEAEYLRMELLVANAEVIRNAIDLLNENHGISKADIVSILTEQEITDPSITEQFIDELLHARTQVSEALQLARQRGELGEQLYKAASNAPILRLLPNIPIDDIEFGYSPLAIGLMLPHDLYIQQSANSIGLYSSDVNFHFYDKNPIKRLLNKGTTVVQVPLVLLDTDEAEAHELAHAKAAPLESALHKNGRSKVTWGEIIKPVTDADMEALEDVNNPNHESAINRFVEMGLARAKHEVLANMMAGEQIAFDHLMTKGGSYDYVSDWMKIPKNTAVYDEVWKRYNARLRHVEHAIGLLYKLYQREAEGLSGYSKFQERLNLYPWMLSLMPMQQWIETFESWNDELFRFNKIKKDIHVPDEQFAYSEYLHNFFNGISISDQEAALLQKLIQIGKHCKSNIENTLPKPISKILDEYDGSRTLIVDQIEGTLSYQLDSLYHDFEAYKDLEDQVESIAHDQDLSSRHTQLSNWCDMEVDKRPENLKSLLDEYRAWLDDWSKKNGIKLEDYYVMNNRV